MKKTAFDVALLLNISQEEANQLREFVSDVVVEQYLNGHRGLLIEHHPPFEFGVRWDKLCGAIRELVEDGQKPSPSKLAEVLGPRFRRKSFEADGSIKKTGFRQGSKKYAPTWISVVQGGGVGVAGKHSRRSRGVRRS